MASKLGGGEAHQMTHYRKSNQRLAPAVLDSSPATEYSLYPSFPTTSGMIQFGFSSLARCMAGSCFVRIDGFVGVLWGQFRDCLHAELERLGVAAAWIDVSEALKPAALINELVTPYLGGDDPLFGTRFSGSLSDFFVRERLAEIARISQPDRLTIVYGCGASLVESEGPLVYVDLPKNELQYRTRAGTVRNLGGNSPLSAGEHYKRFYFVDWPALNQRKAEIVRHVDWFVDGQRPDEPTIISGDALRDVLDRMSRNVFRARPWFEPGPWGGQWLKRRLSALPQDELNYAWSFELITPENGIALCDGQFLCEVSFDWLMYYRSEQVLGNSAERFGFDFPIRFDFLDTFDGGNLSLQCHPRPEYILRHFGEPFTQDETYYIVDCKPGAEVYLGFQAGVDREEFRSELEGSFRESTPIDVNRFVQAHPSHRHDLFLIPSGTIHCSGTDNLVLEISATPYIFTFKMYDWLRLDLEGKPRPLNINRAFDNLQFNRQGAEVSRQLVSRPRVLESGDDWQLIHLATHEEHFYDVHRFDFATEVTCETNGSPHVLMVVEGQGVIVETRQGVREQFNFVETFVVPAAAESYRLINQGPGPVKVVKAFLKSPP